MGLINEKAKSGRGSVRPPREVQASPDSNGQSATHICPTPGSVIDPASPLWRRVLALHDLGVRYKEGATLKDCAQAAGAKIRWETIRYRFETAGIERRPPGRPRGVHGPSEKTLAWAKVADALRRKGMTLAAIGRVFGTSRQRVHQLLKLWRSKP